MSKQRYINTVFWDDDYISNLDPSEKLLFIYLITNPCTTICGIYQVPIKRMALDTGIEMSMCNKILSRFQKDDKVLYRDGWIAIRNFIKHQNEKSPKVKIGIINELEKVPRDLKKWIGVTSDYSIPIVELLTKRQIILIRDSFQCQYCSKEIKTDNDYEIDHIVPLSIGGKDNYANLVLSCIECNQKKLDKTAMEFCGISLVGKKYHSEIATKELRNDEYKKSKFFLIYPEKYGTFNDNQNESTLSHLNLNLDSNLDSNHNLYYDLKEKKKKYITDEILLYWNSKNLIKHELKTVKLHFKKLHKDIIHDIGIEKVKEGIENYDKILNDKIYYYSHNYSLWDFIARKKIYNFLTDARPFENYINKDFKEKQKEFGKVIEK